jgi:hypothetical protein
MSVTVPFSSDIVWEDYFFATPLTLTPGSWFFVGARTFRADSFASHYLPLDTTPPISSQGWGVNFAGDVSGGVLAGGTFFTDFTWNQMIRSHAETVPEPASLLLVGAGLVGAVRAVRRRRG